MERFESDMTAALSAKEQDHEARVAAIVSAYDPERPEAFGQDVAGRLSEFSEAFLDRVSGAELGDVRDIIGKLRLTMKGLGAEKLEKKGFLSGLFFDVKSRIEAFRVRYESAKSTMDDIAASLERDRLASGLAVEDLRILREEAVERFRELTLHCIAGRRLLDDERAALAREEAEISSLEGHEAEIRNAEIRRRRQNVELLDRRLTNLEKSRGAAFAMIPAFQQSLASEIVLGEEIAMAIDQTVPMMKTQLALVIQQAMQAERLKNQAATRDANEAMMSEIADRLGESSAMLDKQTREGMASAESVVAFVERIGTTLSEADARAAEAAAAREKGRADIRDAVNELADQLRGRA